MTLSVNNHIQPDPRVLQADYGMKSGTDYGDMPRVELIRRILDLEEQTGSLQQTVCYLLIKNESLRHGYYAMS